MRYMRPTTSYSVLLAFCWPTSGGRMLVTLSTFAYSWVLSLTFQLAPTSKYRIDDTLLKLMVGVWMVGAGQVPGAQTSVLRLVNTPPEYQRSVRLMPQTSF